MAKPQHKHVWVQRYVRRTEDYLIKAPIDATADEIVRFAEFHVCCREDPQSEETLELTVSFDKLATKKEITYFKGEATVMP
jgi:hypothetical protein